MPARGVAGHVELRTIELVFVGVEIEVRARRLHFADDASHRDFRTQRVADDGHRHAARDEGRRHAAPVVLAEILPIAAVKKYEQRPSVVPRRGWHRYPRCFRHKEIDAVARRGPVGEIGAIGYQRAQRPAACLPALQIGRIVRHRAAVVIEIRKFFGRAGWNQWQPRYINGDRLAKHQERELWRAMPCEQANTRLLA